MRRRPFPDRQPARHRAAPPPRGTGLAELLLALTLLALLLSIGVRGGVTLRDRWATIGARDALIELVHEARSRAVERGGATVILDAEHHDARLEAAGNSLRHLFLATDFGVSIDLGTLDEAHLVFDAAGVGRMASRTFDLVRGRARARLVVSTYGRIR